MCCGLFECIRGVVFFAVIFSINNCDNIIYVFIILDQYLVYNVLS